MAVKIKPFCLDAKQKQEICVYHETGEPTVAAAGAPATPAAPAIQRDFSNMFEKLTVAFSIPADLLMTAAEYMAVDNQLPTSDSLSDGQIIEMVTSSTQSSQAASDEDDEGEEEGASVEEERVSSSAAVNAIDTLMRYFEQSADYCGGR